VGTLKARACGHRDARLRELDSLVRFYRMVHLNPDFFCGFWVG
jgi:hypothetical protein